MASDHQRLISTLVGVLVLVIAISAGVFYLLPNAAERLTAPSTDNKVPSQFNLQVLDRATYKFLDQHLIQIGDLPVRPPTAVGKANPFL